MHIMIFPNPIITVTASSALMLLPSQPPGMLPPEPGRQVTVPVKIYNFANIGSFSLTLDYDPGVLVYQTSSLVPAIGGTFTAATTGSGRLTLSWNGPAATLPDSSNLINLTFQYNSGSTPLAWFDDGNSCKYTEGVSSTGLYDLPKSRYYINGYIGPNPLATNFTASTSAPETSTIITFTDLTTGSPTGWIWDISPSTFMFTGGTSPSSQNPKVIFATTGTYSVTLITTRGSASGIKMRSYNVTRLNHAPVANAGSDQNVSVGTLVTLNGSGSSDADGDSLSFTWFAPEGITLTNPTSVHPTFTAPDGCIITNYLFTLMVNDGFVNSAADTVIITVTPASNHIVALGSTEICPGVSAQLKAPVRPGWTFQWLKNTMPIADAVDSVYSANTTGNYSVQINHAGICTDTSNTIPVTLNPATPVPVITGPAMVCIGSIGTLYTTDEGMTNYAWTVSSEGTITSGGGPEDHYVNVTWNSTGIMDITVNYTDLNGCSALAPSLKQTSVNPLPTPSISGPSHLCSMTAGAEYFTESGMTSYNWSVSPGGEITTGAGTARITITWNTPGLQNVSVNYSDLSGCSADFPSILEVTIEPLSDGGSVTGGSAIIFGQSTGPLGLSGSTGDVVIWQKMVDGSSYEDIPGSEGLTEYSEIPVSIGYWSYRAIVQSFICEPATSQPAIVNVIGIPSMTTLSAGEITYSEANLYGSGKMNGSLATVIFEYGLTDAFGMSVAGDPSVITGDLETPVMAAVSGLLPDTVYYFRISGTNIAGTGIGETMSFRTEKAFRHLSVTAFFEGLYDNSSGLMRKTQDCLDGESTFDKFDGPVTDTVSVRLANQEEPWDNVFESHGLAIGPDGQITLLVPAVLSGNYYIVVNHRQSVETWSKLPVSFSADPVNYDFSFEASQAYANNMKEIDTDRGIFAFFGGDVTSMTGNQDGYVDIFDNNDVFNYSQSGSYGYLVEDLTGDAFVDIFDMVIVFNNMQSGAGMNTPPNPMKK